MTLPAEMRPTDFAHTLDVKPQSINHYLNEGLPQSLREGVKYVLTMDARREDDTLSHLSQSRRLEIRSKDPAAIEAMLWQAADEFRASVPPEVGRQVLRLIVKIEEEMGL